MGEGLRKIIFSGWLYRIVRIVLALLFIYSGAAKLMAPKTFAGVISSYNLIPEILLPFVAIGLPILEAVAGLALLCDIRGSLAVISGLLGLFLAVLGDGIISGIEIDCGCFGVEDIPGGGSPRQAFYRDLVIIGIVVPFLYISRRVRAQRKAPNEFLQ